MVRTSSAPETSTSPKTCGWRWISFSMSPSSDVVDVPPTVLRRHLRVEHHLQQQVTELVADGVGVARIDRFEQLVRLFEKVVRQRLMRLLPVPRTSARARAVAPSPSRARGAGVPPRMRGRGRPGRVASDPDDRRSRRRRGGFTLRVGAPHGGDRERVWLEAPVLRVHLDTQLPRRDPSATPGTRGPRAVRAAPPSPRGTADLLVDEVDHMPSELRLDGLRDLSRFECDDGARRTRARTAPRERSAAPRHCPSRRARRDLARERHELRRRRVLHTSVDVSRFGLRSRRGCGPPRTVVNSSARCSYWERSSSAPICSSAIAAPDRTDRQDLRAELEEVIACHVVRVERLASARRLRTASRAARWPPRPVLRGGGDVVGVRVVGRPPATGARRRARSGCTRRPRSLRRLRLASARGALEIRQRLLQGDGLPKVRILDVLDRRRAPPRACSCRRRTNESDQEHASGTGNGHRGTSLPASLFERRRRLADRLSQPRFHPARAARCSRPAPGPGSGSASPRGRWHPAPARRDRAARPPGAPPDGCAPARDRWRPPRSRAAGWSPASDATANRVATSVGSAPYRSTVSSRIRSSAS